MKKTKILNILISILVIMPVLSHSENSGKTAGSNAVYVFDGSGSSSGKAKITGGKIVFGHDGKAGGASSFEMGKVYDKSNHNIIYPLDINARKIPQITITAWVKASNHYGRMFIFGNGTDKRNRAVIIDNHDDQYRYGLQCGKDGVLYGSPVVDEWVFVAAIYDSKNQEARLVVNGTVFRSRAKTFDGEEKAFTGPISGAVDDIRVFDRVLTQAEIEAISGIAITTDADDLAIKDRYSYKERRKEEEENRIKVGDVYVIDGKDFKINDTTNYERSTAMLTTGDTIKVIEKLKDGWYKVAFSGGRTGFVTRGTINKDAYPKGGSSFKHKFMYNFQHIFDFTKMRSWIIVIVFAIIIFFVKKYFTRLDSFLLRLRKGGDEYSDGGGKSSPSPIRHHFLDKVYPVKRWPWYPMLTGVLLGATIFIGSFWDTYEMEWFYNEGFNLLPIGYDRPVHWFLYIMSMVTILLTLSWIIESFYVGGPLVGLLRVFLLLIINFMTWMVTFFLLVLLAIIVVAILALRIFGSAAAGSGNYKCPRCGRTFSASAGSSTHCPGCGASLST